VNEVWPWGSLANARTFAASIRKTPATSFCYPKPPSTTSKCQALPYFAS
jgi:hypothetical protein